MKLQRIAIDLDDVIAEYVPTLTKFYNKIYGTQLDHNSIKTWELKDYYEHTRTDEETRALMTLFAHNPDFLSMPPVPGAIESIHRLEPDYELHVITARASRSIDATYNWMKEHGISNIPVWFNKDKGKMCEQLGIDLMIDDGVHNLDRVADTSKLTSTLLFDQPWNRKNNYVRGHERAKDWDEVNKIIRSYE